MATTYYIRPNKRDLTPPKFLRIWDLDEIQGYGRKHLIRTTIEQIADKYDIPELKETHDFHEILRILKDNGFPDPRTMIQ